MIKKKFTALRDWFEDGLRSLLGQITPDGRVVIILVMLLVFSVGSIYMTISSFYNLGKKNGKEQLEIEHIKRLELEYKQKTDSINYKNKFNYE